jgi:hypothetical protein
VVVLAAGEIGDPAGTVGNRGEDDGTVADRLIAGNRYLALERPFDRLDPARAGLFSRA